MTAQEIAECTNAEIVRRYFDQVWDCGELAAVERFFGQEFTNSAAEARTSERSSPRS